MILKYFTDWTRLTTHCAINFILASEEIISKIDLLLFFAMLLFYTIADSSCSIMIQFGSLLFCLNLFYGELLFRGASNY